MTLNNHEAVEVSFRGLLHLLIFEEAIIKGEYWNSWFSLFTVFSDKVWVFIIWARYRTATNTFSIKIKLSSVYFQRVSVVMRWF